MFKNEEGFSLLELVVAVGVAGIIAAVALPTFAGLQDKATSNSATYAASASAAEALANSTIGGVNNTTSNNSSYTGGASSSASNTGGSSSSSQAAISYLVAPTTSWHHYYYDMFLDNVSSVPSDLAANPTNYKVVITGGNYPGEWVIQSATTQSVMGPPSATWLKVNIGYIGISVLNGTGSPEQPQNPDSGVLSIQPIN